MVIAMAVCALALASGAGAPFGQPESEGLYKEPIPRYVEVQYDFLAPPVGTVPPGMPPVEVTPSSPPIESVPALPPPPEAQAPPVQLSCGPAQVGEKSYASLSLHPEGLQQATASFPAVMIRPVVGEWPRAFLLFRAGLADPVAPLEGDAKPTPLTLTVAFGEQVIHTEEVAERKWVFRAVDVTGLAGQMSDLTFRASTMNPEERLSVLCLGEPMLVEEQGVYYLRPGGRSLAFGFSLGNFPQGTAGLALAQVQCEADATVDMSLGDGAESHVLKPGIHWLPLTFTRSGRFAFKATTGDVKFLRLDVAPFTPPPHFQKTEPAKP